MTDLLQRGNTALERHRNRSAFILVDYQRDGSPLATGIKATVGRSDSEQVDRNGFVTQTTMRDFIVSVLLLPTEPLRDDVIIETDELGIHHYQVLPMDEDPAQRYADQYRQAYRIHTKHLKTV